MTGTTRLTGRNILLVEDNPQDEKLMLRALARIELAQAVDVVRDGQQALDYLFTSGAFAHRAGVALPAVVLLDIELPRVSGLTVLERLRAHPHTRLLPVVMLTSSDDERDRRQAYVNGANSYVRKPVTPTEFSDTVGRLGLYWSGTNEPPGGP